jgi:nucleoside-diphosphate-sugar epimerase
MIEKETILVTGAGGFIGGWIVETLHLDRTAVPRAGVRAWSSAARLARFPVEIVLCDVMDKESIARAMSGASCVIHCVSGTVEAIVQGTANVLDVARARKVRRFVHLSTTEVYGDAEGRIDETFPFRSTGNLYGDAKIEAEKLCWGHREQGLPVTVIRPSIVYGPFSKDWTVGFAQRLQSGNWRTFLGYGEGICNLVYVSDLVSGILSAARHERAVGEAFNLVGPESMTWNQYFQKFNAALGLPELRVIDPANARLRSAVMDPIRRTGKLVLKRFKTPLRKLSQEHRLARGLLQHADRSMKTTPRLVELSLYNRHSEYPAAKARDLLGYEPGFGIDRGLALSVGWLENVGLAGRRS